MLAALAYQADFFTYVHLICDEDDMMTLFPLCDGVACMDTDAGCKSDDREWKDAVCIF